MKDDYGKDASRLQSKKLFLFDMDGTIYLADTLFEGIPQLLKKIEEKGGRYVLSPITRQNPYSITLRNCTVLV